MMKNFAKILAVAAWGLAAAAWAKPDLVISSVSLSTNKAIPGTKITIDSVTRNNGDATGWWKYCDVYYYWGTASNKKAVKIGTGVTPNYQEVNGIDKGEEEEDSLSWTIPAGTTPGIYYITCVADAENEIDEGTSNEGNNERSVKFTVQGEPAFSDLKWLQPLDVSSNDWVSAYGECANLSTGRTVTLEIWQSKTGLDSQVATVTTKVQYSGGTYFFNRSMKASWASGNYYFEASASEGADSCEGNSGEEKGVMLAVSNDRMVPSYSSSKNDFYYDNESTSDPGFRGATSGKVALTDDRIPIILVHGMSGDAKPKTLNYWYGWMNADTSGTLGYFNQGAMTNMFRVYRYVYDSRDNISTNGDRLATFVNNFYNRHTEFKDRQVVIMAHSMGGLVSRYAMNHNPSFAEKVHRLVTLGSPHLGAQGANPTWIKYSGPDDNSWFVSSIYNTFNLHNNTAGCFDLAWYAPNEIPQEALTEDAIAKMGDSYRTDLMRNSITNPFTGWDDMRSKAADNKCVLFGGSSTNEIKDTLRKSWPDDPSGEVKTDHLGLWVATKIYRSMSYRDGTGVGDNDGLVPLISALMNDSLSCAKTSDRNAHPTAVKYNLNALEGQQVDHASYLDVPVTMDSVKAVLLTQVRGYCQPAAAITQGARWRLIDNVTGEKSPWQKSEVRLPALVAGRSYTVSFAPATNYVAPSNVTFTATKSVTKVVRGTYTTGTANHAPTSLALNNAGVDEGLPAGTEVGTLSAFDQDGDSISFEVVGGAFTVSGNRLLTAAVFTNAATPTVECTVRAVDGKGAASESETFTIEIRAVHSTTPAQATGDAWLALSWAPVTNASYYRVDVTAGAKANDSVYAVPKQPLGTNTFLGNMYWRYIAPEVKMSVPSGSVKTAPAWFTYGSTRAHGLFGTNTVALVTGDLPLLGAENVKLVFTNGNWNGGGDTNVSRIDAYYRIDKGEWISIGSSIATSDRDGGEVGFSKSNFVNLARTGGTIAFKLQAPNAYRDANWQRGAYVTEAVVTLSGQGDFGNSNVHLPGYPRLINVTDFQIQDMPADTPYWYHVEAMVDGKWVEVASGRKVTEDTVPIPQNLTVTGTTSTGLTVQWTDPGAVDHFDVELTPVVAAGTESEISSVPNVYLRSSENTSRWGYATNHVPTAWGTSNTWLLATTNVDWDYHILLGARAPGVQSANLDLSGFESATLRFVARTRNGTNGVESVPMVLSYSLDEGHSWTEAASARTNSWYIHNNQFIYLELPDEALAESVRLELSCPTATASEGNGVRNITLLGTGKAAPDYGAETAIALDPVPSPLANAAEAVSTASTTAKGLAAGTNYWVHVRSVDRWGHASAWVEVCGTTAPASEPTSLAMSSRSIRENNAVGAYIGQLSAFDADEGDELTYALAEGEGDDDNALVEIDGAAVRAAATFRAAEARIRRIRVRATDGRGLWSEASFDIEILASAEPPKGVLVPSETLAAMAGACGVRIVAVEPTEDADGEPGLRTQWEEDRPAGARTAAVFDVYVSTNLQEGFSFDRRVTGTEVTVPRDGPAKFWMVLKAE